MLIVKYQRQFEKDLTQAQKRGKNLVAYLQKNLHRNNLDQN